MAYPDTDIDGTPWDADNVAKLTTLAESAPGLTVWHDHQAMPIGAFAEKMSIRLAEGLDIPLTMITPTTFTNTAPLTVTPTTSGTLPGYFSIDPYRIGADADDTDPEGEEYDPGYPHEDYEIDLPEPHEIHLDPYRPANADNEPVDPWEQIANGNAIVAAGGWCAPSETMYKLPQTPTDRVAALAEQHPLVTLRMAIANELTYQGVADPDEAITMALVESVTACYNLTEDD